MAIMEGRGKKIIKMTENVNFPFRAFPEDGAASDKYTYRRRIKASMKYNWRLVHRYSDLFISSDSDIIGRLRNLVHEFYGEIDSVISSDASFLKSLAPVAIKKEYPPIIKEMCMAAREMNVGPMASVAGAVCDYISGRLPPVMCGNLVIENGGDLYLRSTRDLNVGLYIKGSMLNDRLYLKIKKIQTPCGLCSSSGRFGHSLSLGKSDLVTVLAGSTITADAAATAIANTIISENDIDRAITAFRGKNGIRGILIVKNNRIGLWGDMRLSP